LGKFLFASLLLLSACAQQARPITAPAEKSVAPKINDGFTSPALDVGLWAERFSGESREVYTSRFAVLEAIGLDKGSAIADIGAGTGLHTKLFAETVGPAGKVYAVDISEKFLKFIDGNATADGFSNVQTVLGVDRSSMLPDASVDVVFHSDTYHHFEFPAAMNTDLLRALKPGGEMFVLDFERIPGESSNFILGHVRASKQVVIDEVEASGFMLVEEVKLPELKENYLLRFKKP